MRRRIGPVLHVRQGTETEWCFAVGLWLADPDGPPSTLTFDASANARVDPQPTRAGVFDDAAWLFWNVRIPRQAQELRTSYRIDGLTDDPIAVDDVVIPAVGQAPRIAFFSCNGVQDPKNWTTQPEMERLWGLMLKRHQSPPDATGAGGPYHVLVGGGDQIYCDAVWREVDALKKLDTWDKRKKAKVTPALGRALEKLYGKLYERWRVSWFGDLHSRIPGLYAWDDHEIFDGWGSYDDDLQGCPVFQAIFEQARRAFVTIQLGGGPGIPGGLCLESGGSHFLQAIRFDDRLDLLALDLRSQRTDSRVMAEDQWQALHAYLAARMAGGRTPRHLLVVSSIPVVYLNFALAETFLDWLPWRQDLEDDMRDQWESAAHREERARLLMTFFDHGKVSGTRVSLLSGDVHVGARGRIVSKRPEHLLGAEPEAVIHQLTSSAIVYPPPGGFALAGMRAVAKTDPTPLLSVSQVVTEVLPVGADEFLVGRQNWLSIEPDASWDSSKKRLWARWITAKGDVKPPVVIHPRATAV